MKNNQLALALIAWFIPVLFLTALPFAPVQAGLWDMQSEILNPVEDTFDSVSAKEDPQELVVSIIKVFLGFVGLLAIIVLIWGGFRWMNAGGSEENIRQAKKIVIRAIIGLAIIIASYAITEFIAYSVEEALFGF